MCNMVRKILFAAFVVMLATIGCGSNQGEEYINSIKNGYLDDYPEISVGEAFSNFFEAPTWSYEEDSEDKTDGEYLVQFTGECLILEEDSKVTLFFVVNDAGEFYLDGGYIEGSPEGITPEMAVYAAFSEYSVTGENYVGETTESSTADGLTYDLSTDIANGLLNSDGNGHIVDNNGNIIPEYSYIEILENGSLYDSSSDCILEGYGVARNGQLEGGGVTYEDWGEDYDVNNSGSSLTEMIGLISGHYTNPDSPIIFTIPDEVYGDTASDMFVYIKMYYGTLDDMYANECTGMINLLDLGTVTVQDGLQSMKWFTYTEDTIDGGCLSSFAEEYCSDLKIRYDEDASNTYCLDNDLSDTILYENNQIDYATLYEKNVSDIVARRGEQLDYVMHDLNQDGYLELFIGERTSNMEVYSTDGSESYYLGEIPKHGMIYFYERVDGQGIFVEHNAGLDNKISLFTLENGEFNREIIYEGEMAISNFDGVGECINSNWLPEGLYW